MVGDVFIGFTYLLVTVVVLYASGVIWSIVRESLVARRIRLLGGTVDFDYWSSTYDVVLTDTGLDWCLQNLCYIQPCFSLKLSGLALGDEDIDFLRPYRDSLLVLDVSGTRISNAFVEGLAGFLSLSTLKLRGTRISDEVIAVLAAIPSLNSVDLSGTDCTVEGIDRLRQLKPKLHIVTGFIDDRFQAE